MPSNRFTTVLASVALATCSTLTQGATPDAPTAAAGSRIVGPTHPVLAGTGPCTNLDGDNATGFSDLLELLAFWGPCAGCPADLDGSGIVDFSDLLELLASWGPCPCLDLEEAAGAIIPLTGLPLSLDSKTYLDTATDANVDALRSLVYAEWGYLAADLTGFPMTIFGFSKLGVLPVPPDVMAEHMAVLSSGARSLQPGDTVYTMAYTILTPGGPMPVTGLAYEGPDGCAKLDPFLFLIPLLGDSPLAGSDYIGVTNPGTGHDVEFKVEWAIGQATGWGDVTVHCNGNQIANCSAQTGHNASFLSEAECTKEAPQVFTLGESECCSVTFHFGFANGFKSIEVGADGVSIAVEGNFGYSGTRESKVCKCCPDGGC